MAQVKALSVYLYGSLKLLILAVPSHSDEFRVTPFLRGWFRRALLSLLRGAERAAIIIVTVAACLKSLVIACLTSFNGLR
jgi:hypothetical protein